MKIKEFKSIGETLYSAVLDNGLTVNLVPTPGFNLGYAVFAANYGGAFRKFKLDGVWHDTPAGVAHFLEHKMFDLPDGDNALNRLSANGAQPNAFTSSGITAYYFDCTHGFEENLRELLHFVSTPYFTKESVEKEQGIIGQEIGMVEDSPGYVVYNRLMRLLYAHHPIREQVAGSVESIAEISAETLYNCHKAFYNPSNMTLAAAGNFDPEKILRIIEEEITAPAAEVPEIDFGEKESLLPCESRSEEKMEVSAPQFLIGAKLDFPEKGEELLRRKIVSQLALRAVFGYSSGFYNRLYSQGLLNRDYEYEIDCTAGTATVMIGGESPDPAEVLRQLKAEVKLVCEKGIEPEAFERSVRASYGARIRGLEDFDNICVSLAMGSFEGYCALDSFEVLRSVTIEECSDFICSNLSDERLALSVVMPVN